MDRAPQPQPGDHLCNASPFRPLLWSEDSARPFPRRWRDRNAQRRESHAIFFHSPGWSSWPHRIFPGQIATKLILEGHELRIPREDHGSDRHPLPARNSAVRSHSGIPTSIHTIRLVTLLRCSTTSCASPKCRTYCLLVDLLWAGSIQPRWPHRVVRRLPRDTRVESPTPISDIWASSATPHCRISAL